MSPGNTADIVMAQPTVDASRQTFTALAADKAYDADAFREYLKCRAIQPVIPSRLGRLQPVALDKSMYRQRNSAERMFARLKQFRRFATRYERSVSCWRGICLLAFLRAALAGGA